MPVVPDTWQSSYGKARRRAAAKSLASLAKLGWPPGKSICGAPSRSAIAAAVRCGNWPLEVVPPGDDDPARRALKSGEVRQIKSDGQQAVTKEALARRHRLGRRWLRRGVLRQDHS